MKSVIPVSQAVPWYPVAHMQVYFLTELLQAALFLQGELLHLLKHWKKLLLLLYYFFFEHGWMLVNSNHKWTLSSIKVSKLLPSVVLISDRNIWLRKSFYCLLLEVNLNLNYLHSFFSKKKEALYTVVNIAQGAFHTFRPEDLRLGVSFSVGIVAWK